MTRPTAVNPTVATAYAELKLNKNWSTGFQFDYAPIVDSPGAKDHELLAIPHLESQRI